jgi:hypothetical protein
VGDGKNFECIFEFSVKSYVTNTINLSCAKILLPSVITITVTVKKLLVVVVAICYIFGSIIP